MDVLRQILSVFLVFTLLGAALWAVRKGGSLSIRGIAWKRAQQRGRSIVPVERIALTPQHTLHVIHVNGHEILVATHPGGCTLLTAESKANQVKGAGV